MCSLPFFLFPSIAFLSFYLFIFFVWFSWKCFCAVHCSSPNAFTSGKLSTMPLLMNWWTWEIKRIGTDWHIWRHYVILQWSHQKGHVTCVFKICATLMCIIIHSIGDDFMAQQVDGAKKKNWKTEQDIFFWRFKTSAAGDGGSDFFSFFFSLVFFLAFRTNAKMQKNVSSWVEIEGNRCLYISNKLARLQLEFPSSQQHNFT